MHYNAFSMEKKTHKIAPSPWDFARLPKDRATWHFNELMPTNCYFSRDLTLDAVSTTHNQLFRGCLLEVAKNNLLH